MKISSNLKYNFHRREFEIPSECRIKISTIEAHVVFSADRTISKYWGSIDELRRDEVECRRS